MLMKKITVIQMIFTYIMLFCLGFISVVPLTETKAGASWFVAQSPLLTEGVNYSVSSPFNAPRSFGGSSPHSGVDIVHHGSPGAINGDPIHAMADGKVKKVFNGCADRGAVGSSCGSGLGNHVAIHHGVHKVIDEYGKEVESDVFVVFGHMKKNSNSAIKEGQEVKAGDVVGAVASSGSSTNDHLHVSIYVPGKVGFEGNLFGGAKADATPYIWPEGEQYATGVAFKTAPIMYNTLGEESGPGSYGDTGTNLADPNNVFKDSEAWKNPMVNFKETEYIVNPKGVNTKDDELLSNNLIVAFTNTSNKLLHYAYILMFLMIGSFILYMSFATIFYLILLPQGKATYKMGDIFEKTTGIEASYSRKGVIDILGRDIISLFGIGFVVSGAYIQVFSAIYKMLMYII